jgi:hypothetical protein
MLGPTTSVKAKDAEAHKYFMNLFTRQYISDPDEQPDKLVGLVDFKIVKRQMDETKLELGIIKEDGTEDSISWLSCYNGPSSIREKLISAMIVAVHNHPIELIKHSMTFPYVDAFLANNHPPKFFAKNMYNQRIFREEDSEFRDAWITYYHSKNKYICKKCFIKMNEDGWTTV